MNKDVIEICAFCSKQKTDVHILITGNTGNICDKCVLQANNIVIEENRVNHQEKIQHDITEGVIHARPTPLHVSGPIGPDTSAPRSGRKFEISLLKIKIIIKNYLFFSYFEIQHVKTSHEKAN